MDQRQKRKIAQTRHNIALVKIAGFIGLLVVMGFIGLLWFARPEKSDIEKRNLTTFPAITLEGLWDGSFFSGKDLYPEDTDGGESLSADPSQTAEAAKPTRIEGVETWYADTYPLRELLIAWNSSFQNLYGIRSSQLIGTPQQGDEIPTGEVDLAALAGLTQPTGTSEASTDPVTGETAETSTEAPTEAPTEDNYGAGDVTELGEKSGNIYVTQGCGYGVYNFSTEGSARFCLAVNAAAEALKGKANLYCLICPISAGVMLSDEVLAKTGGTDEKEAIDWMFGNMDDSVKKVNVFDTLKRHNSEYIYFHTDHHWTALGAYYAYTEFCKLKGVTPHQLSDFETREFDGFLGTFYSSSNQNPSLAANPDTVTAYVPNGTNSMKMYTDYGNTSGVYTGYDWSIINDVSSYPRSEYYATFSAGDQPFNYAHNPAITDGSTVLIAKDSFGNAFIPFLVDHYEHIYWIDYRYYSKYASWAGVSAKISDFVERNNVNDVILCVNINNSGNTNLISYMEQVFQ